jgi:hypothetical protein
MATIKLHASRYFRKSVSAFISLTQSPRLLKNAVPVFHARMKYVSHPPTTRAS